VSVIASYPYLSSSSSAGEQAIDHRVTSLAQASRAQQGKIRTHCCRESFGRIIAGSLRLREASLALGLVERPFAQTHCVPDLLGRGRRSLARKAWDDAYQQLSASEQEAPLGLEDLERLAMAAHLTGRDEECAEAWGRAHNEALRRGEGARGAWCAFWLGFVLLIRGEMARGAGGLARARRVLDDGDLDCAERGYLLVPTALSCLEAGNPAGALTMFVKAAEIG
jgi:hypothetical protein